MKTRFKFSHTFTSRGEKWLVWECVSGYGRYQGQTITPGSFIQFSAPYFWMPR